MNTLRSRARRIAFGDSNANLSDNASSSSRSSSHSSFTRNVFRHTSSMTESCSCGSSKPSDIKSSHTHVVPRRTNRVRKIHRSQPFELFVEALEQDGCVIVQDFVNPQIPAQVSQSTVNTKTNSSLDGLDDEDRGREAPLDINSMIRDSLLSDTLYQTLSTHFLTLETISWSSKTIDLSTSKPRLFSSKTRDLNSSFPISSSFNRADSPLHHRHTNTPKYDYQSRRDVTLGLFVPELDTLSASIPVHVIPGSHLWDDQKPDVSRGVKDVQLQGGEAMILLGSLYHSLGESDQEKRPSVSRGSTRSGSGSFKEKLLHDMWMCCGVYCAETQISKDDNEV